MAVIHFQLAVKTALCEEPIFAMAEILKLLPEAKRCLICRLKRNGMEV